MNSHDLFTLAAASTASLWSKYGSQMALELTKSVGLWARLKGEQTAKVVWEKVNWQKAASDYNTRLRRLYGTTSVLGIAEPIPLEGIFTDVYLLDEPSAYRRFDIHSLTEDPEVLDRSHQRTDGVTLVNQQDSNRLFILGKPGAGKTTFLKHLVWQATQGQIKKTAILISLKEWTDSKQKLLPFMSHQFDICGFPKAEPFLRKILEKGIAFVLFDGLDEVKQEDQQRDETIAELRDFTNKYEATQCLITCRIAATSYRFDKFKYVELADFTDDQIRVYVEKWFKDQRSKCAEFFSEFDKPDNKNLRELARTPLLLSLLCLTFDATMAFPKRRVEIYEEAIEALLKKWDSSRAIQRDEAYKGLSVGRKRQMFARIAAKTFQANQYFLPQGDLAAEIVRHLTRLPEPEPSEDIDCSAPPK